MTILIAAACVPIELRADAIAWHAESGLLIIAHAAEATVRGVDPRDGETVWRTEGVKHPRLHVDEGSPLIALLDPLDDRLVLIDPRSGERWDHRTGSMPGAILLDTAGAWVATSDPPQVTRFERGSRLASVAVADDPFHVALHRGTIHVYSRSEGLVEEIDPIGLRVNARWSVPSHASAVTSDRGILYLLDAKTQDLHAIDLATRFRLGSIRAGRLPVDLGLDSAAGPITAGRIVVADPGANSLWLIERSQSAGSAFARGFLRGFLGLGPSRDKRISVDAPVDRVESDGSRRIAYSTTTRDLYLATRRSVRLIASGVEEGCYTLAPDGVWVIRNGVPDRVD